MLQICSLIGSVICQYNVLIFKLHIAQKKFNVPNILFSESLEMFAESIYVIRKQVNCLIRRYPWPLNQGHKGYIQ